MALHGGGHLEFKKMHKGDFWGLFGICLGRCPCIIPEKISFLQFYSRFNLNALVLYRKGNEYVTLFSDDGCLHSIIVIRKLESLLQGDAISSINGENAVIIDANATFYMPLVATVRHTSMVETFARSFLGCSRCINVCVLIATLRKVSKLRLLNSAR